MIRKFFSPPVFENEEDNFRARFLNNFMWVVLLLLIPSTILYIINPGDPYTVPILLSLIAFVLFSIVLLRRRYVNGSAWFAVLLLWLSIGGEAFLSDGVRDSLVPAYVVVSLLASIVISRGVGAVFALLSIPALLFLGWSESSGIIQPVLSKPNIYARDISFAYAAITALIYFSTTQLRNALTRATKSEANLRESNDALRDLNQTLEQRVAARTDELEQANQHNARRARQFEAIAQVTKAAAANQSLEDLLPLLAQVIAEKFEYYHAGIFLLDANREYAELRAANSDGGQRMLSRGHKLRIGQTGIVGLVAATGQPRIALDVGADSAFFNNPDLPQTHSEMALPLSTAGLSIGVLDIQSAEHKAFTEDDVEVLSILAEQVATAIQNARYYEATQELVEEAQRMSGSYLRDAWSALKSQERVIGYVADGNTLKRSNPNKDPLLFSKVANETQHVVRNGEKPRIAVPISVAGRVVGVMNVNVNEEHDWEQDEVDIAKAVADRLSLALEAATLLETTQKRAEIERLTASITGKIGSTAQFDSILRTAAEELSQALGGSEVLVQIQPMTPTSKTEKITS